MANIKRARVLTITFDLDEISDKMLLEEILTLVNTLPHNIKDFDVEKEGK